MTVFDRQTKLFSGEDYDGKLYDSKIEEIYFFDIIASIILICIVNIWKKSV